MLHLLFHAITMIDRLFASRMQRADADWFAMYAQARHGDRAIDYLNTLLADPRRRRSRRALRLAIAEVIRIERREPGTPGAERVAQA